VSEAWTQYLDRPIDFSESFRHRVSQIRDSVAAAIGVPVEHDTDMNYRAGQLLTVYLGPSGVPVADSSVAATMLRVAVSSRGPLWTLMAWHQDSPRHWSPAPVPSGEPAVMIGKVAAAAGLQRVPPERLDELVPGHETDMDGAPATLRDVLFCEVC
jgi:hypothetical protein